MPKSFSNSLQNPPRLLRLKSSGLFCIFRSIMIILFNVSRASKSATRSTLLKKIIMPLISSGQYSPIEAFDSARTFFDSDFKFQQFIIFLVDFIHIVYDKISDSPADMTETKRYDQNDEITIFAFAILIHSLSLGLEASQRTRFA